MKPLRFIAATIVCGSLFPGMLLNSLVSDWRTNKETMARLFNRIVGE